MQGFSTGLQHKNLKVARTWDLYSKSDNQFLCFAPPRPLVPTATVQWRLTVTQLSAWVASRRVTELTERLCSTSCCDMSARSSRSFTPTTVWPAEKDHGGEEPTPEWGRVNREHMDISNFSHSNSDIDLFCSLCQCFCEWNQENSMEFFPTTFSLKVQSSWLPVFCLKKEVY